MRSTTTLLVALALALTGACGGSADEKPLIHATWSWSGAATSCASIAGATQVSILATPAGTGSALEKLVACSANQGELSVPSAGGYVVVLSLLNGSSAMIDATSPVTLDVQGRTEIAASFDGIP